jgi:hypothetical protein
MKLTRKKLLNLILRETQRAIVEGEVRHELSRLLVEQDTQISTQAMEDLLKQVVDGLDNIDISIDYLTAAVTGEDAALIGMAQAVAGRGVGKPGGMIPRAEQLDELNPHKTLAQHEPEDFEEPEEDPEALKTTDKLGGEWAGPIDDEPAPVRPPEEYRQGAIKLLAHFLDTERIDRHAIDAVAWQLYNDAQAADTQAMEEPPKKKKRFKFFDEMIREELAAYLAEKKTKVSKAGKKRVSKKIDVMTQAGECDDNPKQCQAIAYSYEERGKLPKQ